MMFIFILLFPIVFLSYSPSLFLPLEIYNINKVHMLKVDKNKDDKKLVAVWNFDEFLFIFQTK